MSRRSPHDSRSPTIGQTPSRNVPMRSTEAFASKTNLQAYVDGLKLQISEDRKTQDGLVKAVTKMVREISKIRKKQDDYLKEICNILDAQGDENGEEEHTSQESQTQAYDYGLGMRAGPGSGAGDDEIDSVLGASTQPTQPPGEVRVERTPELSISSSPVRSAVQMASSNARTGQTRGSTELRADYVLDLLADEHDIPSDTAVPISEDISATSRLPTPVSPSIRRRAGAKATKRAGPSTERQPAVLEIPASGSVYEPTQSNIPPTAGPSKMRPPPKKTPSSKTKRKLSMDSSYSDRASAKSVKKPFKPTTTAEPRPPRSAKSSAEKKNSVIYAYNAMPPRAQSQVLGGEEGNPFWNCGDCNKPTCSRCAARKAGM